MKSPACRVFALLTLTVFILSMSADANAARRSALGGNQFIDDADDMFAFPHLLTKYKNSVIFDFAPSSSYPSSSMMARGTITFGSENNDWAWQANTGRSDYLDNTAFWAWGGFDRDQDIFAPFLDFGEVQWWDLGVANKFGNNNWGFTVSWASDADKTTPEGQDPTEDESLSMFSFQIGTDLLLNADWALEFGTGTFKDKDPTLDPSDQNDLSFTEFALAVRGNSFRAGGLDWRWMVAFAMESADPKLQDTEKFSMTGFRGNFGPVFGTPGDWLIGSYIYFESLTFQEPYVSGDNSKYKYTEIIFPGYNIAMEYYITSWLAARGSVFSHFAQWTDKIEGHATDNEEIKGKDYDVYWTAGIGFDKEVWGLDLALEEDNLHTGYILGNSQSTIGDTIALITAWLRW